MGYTPPEECDVTQVIPLVTRSSAIPYIPFLGPTCAALVSAATAATAATLYGLPPARSHADPNLRREVIRSDVHHRWHLSRVQRPNAEGVTPTPNYVHYLTAPQSVYATPRTDFACVPPADSPVASPVASPAGDVDGTASHMPSLRDQVQAILNRSGAASCVLPTIETVLPERPAAAARATGDAEQDRYRSDRTAEMCAVVKELYTADVALWARHCAAKW